MRTLSLVALAAIATTAPAAAQTAATPSDVEREVLAVVTASFDAMHAKDTARMHALFEPGARLVLTSTRNGQPAIRVVSIDDFVKRVGSITQEIEEKIFDPQIRVQDNVATVWNRYEFLIDRKPDHCGIDAFQLARFAEGWKIIAIADTQGPCPGSTAP